MRTSLGPPAQLHVAVVCETQRRAQRSNKFTGTHAFHMLILRRATKKHTEVIIMLSGRRLFKGDTLWYLMDMLTWLLDGKYLEMAKVKN